MSDRFKIDNMGLAGFGLIVDTANENKWVVTFGRDDGPQLAARVCRRMNTADILVAEAERHPAGAAVGLYELAKDFARRVRDEEGVL